MAGGKKKGAATGAPAGSVASLAGATKSGTGALASRGSSVVSVPLTPDVRRVLHGTFADSGDAAAAGDPAAAASAPRVIGGPEAGNGDDNGDGASGKDRVRAPRPPPPFNERLARISASLGVTIERFNSTHAVTFNVKGPKDKIREAVRRIASLFYREVTVRVPLPRAHHPFLVGSKGRTIQRVCADTLTKIKLPATSDDPEADVDHVSVTGTPEACAAAEAAIKAISDECMRNSVETLKLPKDMHQMVAGQKHAFAHEVQRDTGASVSFPRPTDPSDEVSLRGSPSEIAAARAKLQARHQEIARTTVEVKVTIPLRARRFVIGPKGRTLNDLCDDTSAFVKLGEPEGDSPEAPIPVSIRGAPADTQRAFNMLMELASNTHEEVSVAPHLHRFVSGPKSANLTRISNETLTHVRAPPYDSESDAYTISGKPSDIARARKMLQALVDEIATVTIPVPDHARSHIIGPGGSAIQAMRKAHNVAILVPAPEDPEDVTVHGVPGAGLEDAVAAIEAVVAAREKAPIRVPVRGIPEAHFGYIIGVSGARVAEVMKETETRIHIPSSSRKDGKGGGANSNSNKDHASAKDADGEPMIVIEGMRTHIDAARERLLQLSEEAAKLPVSLELSVDSYDVARFLPGRSAEILAAAKVPAAVADEVSIVWRLGGGGHRRGGGGGSKKDAAGGDAKKVAEPAADPKGPFTAWVKGPPDVAATVLAAARKHAESTAVETVVIDNAAHAYVIGPKGVRVQSVMGTHGVAVRFPTAGDNVVVTGATKGAVRDAVAALRKLEGEKDELPVTEEAEMPADALHAFVMSDRAIQKSVEAACNVSLHIPPSALSPPSAAAGATMRSYKVNGSPNSVAEARASIAKIVASIVEDHVDVPAGAHSFIIGPGGSRIQAVRATAPSVRIEIPGGGAPRRSRKGSESKGAGKKKDGKSKKDDEADGGEADGDDGDDGDHKAADDDKKAGDSNKKAGDGNKKAADKPTGPIRIVGPKSQIADAKAALLALAKEFTTQPVTITFALPSNTHRALIGPSGRNVTEIQGATSTEIHFPAGRKPGSVSGSGSGKRRDADPSLVRVRGSPDDVARAKERLERLAATFTITEVEVPTADIPTLVGPGGRRINEIRESTGCDIKIPMGKRERRRPKKDAGGSEKPDGEPEAKPEDDASEAKPEGDASEAKKDDTDAGAAGAAADKPEENAITKVKLTGLKVDVDRALKLIARVTAERAKSNATATILVDPEMHRHIIGAGGARITALKEKYDVRIAIPKPGSADQHSVVITGSAAGAKECARAIVELVERTKEQDESRALARAERAERAEREAADGDGADGAEEVAKGDAKNDAKNDAKGDGNAAADRERPARKPRGKARADDDEDANLFGARSEAPKTPKKQEKIDVAAIHWPGIGGAGGAAAPKAQPAHWPGRKN